MSVVPLLSYHLRVWEALTDGGEDRGFVEGTSRRLSLARGLFDVKFGSSIVYIFGCRRIGRFPRHAASINRVGLPDSVWVS